MVDIKLSDTWGTHQAASHLGISDGTLKNWDESGVLAQNGVTVMRTLRGYRKFDPREIQALAERITRREFAGEIGQQRAIQQHSPEHS